MSTDTTAPPAPTPTPTRPAGHTTTPTRAQTARPTRNRLTVPAKPAAVTAANVTTIAGTAMAAAGPAGWAVAAAGAGAVTAGMIARRIIKNRRATSRAGRGLFPKLGPFRPLTSRPGHGLRLPTRGRPSPRPTPGLATGRRPSPRPRPTGSTHPNTPTRRPTSSRPTNGPHSRIPTTRAGRITRRAAAATTRGAGALLRAIGRALRRLWQALSRIMRRRVLGHQDQPPTPQPAPTPPPPARRTRATVRRPTQPTTPHNPPAADTTSTHGRNPAMPTPNGRPAPTPQGPVYAAARRVHAAAAEHKPKGMLEVRVAAYEAPFVIAEIAAAFRLQAEACANQPVDPTWGQGIMAVATMLDAAAQGARRLGPSFDGLHRNLLDNLQQANNAQMWDTTNNNH